MERPSISVLMPNYNDAPYLPEALDAVLFQSVRPLEVIVVDDGSTDSSPSVLAEYAARNPLVRPLRNERNLGNLPTLRRLMALARGDFLYLASSNDKALPGFFEKSMSMLVRFPRADICWSNPGFFRSGNPEITPERINSIRAPAYFSPPELAEIYHAGHLRSLLCAAPALIRRSALERLGESLYELKWHSDFFAATIIAFRSGLCYLPETLTAVRVLQGSYALKGIRETKTELELWRRILELLLSPACDDVRPLVRRAGILWFPGLLLFRLMLEEPRYRQFLTFTLFRRALALSPHMAFRPFVPAWVLPLCRYLKDLLIGNRNKEA